jgi:hypothetical protein
LRPVRFTDLNVGEKSLETVTPKGLSQDKRIVRKESGDG